MVGGFRVEGLGFRVQGGILGHIMLLDEEIWEPKPRSSMKLQGTHARKVVSPPLSQSPYRQVFSSWGDFLLLIHIHPKAKADHPADNPECETHLVCHENLVGFVTVLFESV